MSRPTSNIIILSDPNDRVLGNNYDTFYRNGDSTYLIDANTGFSKQLSFSKKDFFGKYKNPLYKGRPVVFSYNEETWIKTLGNRSKTGWQFISGKSPITHEVEPVPYVETGSLTFSYSQGADIFEINKNSIVPLSSNYRVVRNSDNYMYPSFGNNHPFSFITLQNITAPEDWVVSNDPAGVLPWWIGPLSEPGYRFYYIYHPTQSGEHVVRLTVTGSKNDTEPFSYTITTPINVLNVPEMSMLLQSGWWESSGQGWYYDYTIPSGTPTNITPVIRTQYWHEPPARINETVNSKMMFAGTVSSILVENISSDSAEFVITETSSLSSTPIHWSFTPTSLQPIRNITISTTINGEVVQWPLIITQSMNTNLVINDGYTALEIHNGETVNTDNFPVYVFEGVPTDVNFIINNSDFNSITPVIRSSNPNVVIGTTGSIDPYGQEYVTFTVTSTGSSESAVIDIECQGQPTRSFTMIAPIHSLSERVVSIGFQGISGEVDLWTTSSDSTFDITSAYQTNETNSYTMTSPMFDIRNTLVQFLYSSSFGEIMVYNATASGDFLINQYPDFPTQIGNISMYITKATGTSTGNLVFDDANGKHWNVNITASMVSGGLEIRDVISNLHYSSNDIYKFSFSGSEIGVGQLFTNPIEIRVIPSTITSSVLNLRTALGTMDINRSYPYPIEYITGSQFIEQNGNLTIQLIVNNVPSSSFTDYLLFSDEFGRDYSIPIHAENMILQII